MKKILLSSLLVGALASSAMAESNFYGGLSIGQAKYDTGISNVNNGSLDEKDTTKGIFFGYNFNKYVGVEAAYNDFGESTLDVKNGGSFTANGTNYVATADAKAKIDAKSFGLSVLLKYPLHQYFVPYAKVGLHRYSYEASENSSLGNYSYKDDGTDMTYGLGIEANFPYHITARVGYDKYEFDNDDIETTTFSLIYNF